MKKLNLIRYALTGMVLMLIASSCKKEATSTPTATSTLITSSLLTSNAALFAGTAASSSSDTSKRDSIYMIGCYPGGGHADSVAFSALPSAVATYLTANYSGYTFKKAFKALTKAGAVDSYVVLITLNGNPIGLKFDATGTFVAVLKQMDRQDMGGPGDFHPGGPFDDRDGKCQDTIAISALNSAITTYFKANYPTDTLVHAVVNHDGSFTVFSNNKGLFATSFTAKFVFINHIQLVPHAEMHASVTQANLPAAIAAYLNTTYPGFVFDKAFSETVNKVIDKYVVLIAVNSTRYAVQFDGSGNFVKAVVVR
jgi:hypothetical protein